MANVNTAAPQQPNMKKGNEKKRFFEKFFENKLAYGLTAFILALGIIALVLGSTFYLVIKNNVNGMGEKYRKEIQGIPVLNRALPKAADPDDPKYLNQDQLVEKYNQLRKDNEELNKKLKEASTENAELQLYKNSEDRVKAESEAAKKELEAQGAQLETKRKEIADERKKLDEMIATGDKAAFKEFYEKVDKETAQRVYASIMTEQKATEDAKKFAQLYENMDAAAAAKIFEEMGTTKIDLTVDILKNMKKESTAEVLAAMTPSFASKVTDKLSKIYLPAAK